MTVDPQFAFQNHVEAGFWCALGIVFAAAAGFQKRSRRQCIGVAIVFIGFGGSDLVEAQTGAWWRPWWLLLWKGVCVLILLEFARRHFAARRRRPSE